MEKIKTIEQAKAALDKITKDYLEELEQFINDDGEVDFGGGIIGWEDESSLIVDVMYYVDGQD
jgi:hypothetical protein